MTSFFNHAKPLCCKINHWDCKEEKKKLKGKKSIATPIKWIYRRETTENPATPAVIFWLDFQANEFHVFNQSDCRRNTTRREKNPLDKQKEFWILSASVYGILPFDSITILLFFVSSLTTNRTLCPTGTPFSILVSFVRYHRYSIRYSIRFI